MPLSIRVKRGLLKSSKRRNKTSHSVMGTKVTKLDAPEISTSQEELIHSARRMLREKHK